MMIKIVTLFLIGMAVLAMFGRLRMPRIGPLSKGKCPRCGRHRIGKSPCPCKSAGV
ncbi:MAG: hypothetical protein AAGC86_01525 [Pseudomonadota bacterium]